MTEQRSVWKALGALHAVVYFHPEAANAYRAIGLRGYWSGYFASRSAALGTPSARVVTALFHGFAPAMVERAIPDAWTLAAPADILKERGRLAVDALQQCLPEGDIGSLNDELQTAADRLDFAGKPLAAAHADCAAPAGHIGELWQAATVLREYRGDVHIAVLTAHGLDGISADALHVAVGAAAADHQKTRGWDDQAWAAAVHELAARGWVDPAGLATDEGRARREDIEESTDVACGSALNAMSSDSVALIKTLARAVVVAGAIPKA